MYGKYRVVAFDENDREIGAHVYDGVPEQVISEMATYLLEHAIYAKRFEISIVTYDTPLVR